MSENGQQGAVLLYLVVAVLLLGILAIGGFWFFGQSGSGPAALNSTTKDDVEQRAEKVLLSSELLENCVGFLTGAADELGNISLAGGAWVRPHPGPFDWGVIEKSPGRLDYSQTDDYVKAAQEEEIAILATVWPFAEWDQKGRDECKVSETDLFYPRKAPFGPREGITSYRCAPSDMGAYGDFLKNLVERYDGDGVDDMPGLVLPVKHWEIGNEPDLPSSPEHTFFVGSSQDYLELLRESYLAVKSACADCMVLHAGAAGVGEDSIGFWGSVYANGGGEFFDIANVHYISFGDNATLNAGPLGELLGTHGIDKPIWVTEVEFPDSGSDVVAGAQGAFDAGAEKLFFVNFEVGGLSRPEPGVVDSRYGEVASLCR